MSENLSNNSDSKILEAVDGIGLDEVNSSLLDDSVLNE